MENTADLVALRADGWAGRHIFNLSQLPIQTVYNNKPLLKTQGLCVGKCNL